MTEAKFVPFRVMTISVPAASEATLLPATAAQAALSVDAEGFRACYTIEHVGVRRGIPAVKQRCRSAIDDVVAIGADLRDRVAVCAAADRIVARSAVDGILHPHHRR